MRALGPMHWLILAVVLLLLAGYRTLPRSVRRSRFFEGMDRTSTLAILGALFLVVALLIEVYADDAPPVADGAAAGGVLAVCGGLFVLASLVSAWLWRRRRG